MAEPVNEMPSNKTAPWARYADGQTWELDTTTDLEPPSTPTRARHAAYAWGRRNGYIVSCRTRGESTLYVQFTAGYVTP